MLPDWLEKEQSGLDFVWAWAARLNAKIAHTTINAKMTGGRVSNMNATRR
jgi:hypothetical protein